MSEDEQDRLTSVACRRVKNARADAERADAELAKLADDFVWIGDQIRQSTMPR